MVSVVNWVALRNESLQLLCCVVFGFELMRRRVLFSGLSGECKVQTVDSRAIVTTIGMP